MKRAYLVACPLVTCLAAVSPLRGDGCYFYPEGQAADLAQTRQEVLLAIYDHQLNDLDRVTYVLRTHYTGEPSEFAWVIPVPNTPTEVIAHETDEVFDYLNSMTRPRFTSSLGRSSGGGCSLSDGAGQWNAEGGLVEVEASGQAGIFEWAALTSTGADALLNWLNQNSFAVPAEAGDVLDAYIGQGMHFLALRVNEPDQVEADGSGQIEIPPVQFTCWTSMRFYPMAISQISAADETEVVVYVLANHRVEAANLPNAVIDPDTLAYDPGSPSLTNYESLFTQTIADLGGVALITEYARPGLFWVNALHWLGHAPGTVDLTFLTRMRTVIARDRMDLDFEFRTAGQDEVVDRSFYIDDWPDMMPMSLAGEPVAALFVFGIFRAVMSRRRGLCRRHL